MTLNMDGVLTVLNENKDCLKIQDSSSRCESETEDTEKSQATPQQVFESLSKYTVRKNGAYEKSICGLCHSNYSIGDSVVCLPCHHNFHEYCIENWLKWVKSTCPFDKKSVIRNVCLRQVETERYQMKIQKLLLKSKTTSIYPKEITIKKETSEDTADKPPPSPVSVKNDVRISSPLGRPEPKEKELRPVVISPLRKHSSRKNRCEGLRTEEAVKSADKPTTPRSGKHNLAPRPPAIPKSTIVVKNPPQKFNYRDFLKSPDSPWNMPFLISSYRNLQIHSSRERTFFNDKANQKCSRVNRESHLADCDGFKLFRKMASRKCPTSAGLRYSDEKRGGWVYKNDISLLIRKSGSRRMPKTA